MVNIKLLNRAVTIIYASIQATIAIFVSILGAIHVRRAVHANKSIQSSTTVNDDSQTAGTVTVNIDQDADEIKHKSFCELWLRTMWKMRSVYACLTVHSFDVLTDVLVIFQWLNTKDEDGDNINPQIMAYSGITVIVFSRVISAIAIFIKDRDFIRSVLQLFDLLIFQEIYESHHKIVSQFKNKQIKSKKEPIEATLSFKYVRNMEAIFESIPESVLQLVYVMRVGTSNFDKSQPLTIFIISIIQSIISMSNAMLNNDYTMMKEDKWKKHKQRFPPTLKFLQHATCRISEIIYRIGLLALFWTVCEGLAFSVLLVYEVLIILIKTGALLRTDDLIFDADTILLAISSIIIIPSEEIFGVGTIQWHEMFGSDTKEMYKDDGCFLAVMVCGAVIFINMCCCMGAASCLASVNLLCGDDGADISVPPIVRIGTSLCEIVFIVIWAFFAENGERAKFLLAAEHGLVIFIVTCICFLVFSQYRILFPNFALPLNVSVRSKWGYAYSNELSELKKIHVPLKKMPYQIKRKSRERKEKKDVVFTIENEGHFWDEPYTLYDGSKPMTAAMFALVKGNDEIVKWLEARGATKHKQETAFRIKSLISSDKK